MSKIKLISDKVGSFCILEMLYQYYLDKNNDGSSHHISGKLSTKTKWLKWGLKFWTRLQPPVTPRDSTGSAFRDFHIFTEGLTFSDLDSFFLTEISVFLWFTLKFVSLVFFRPQIKTFSFVRRIFKLFEGDEKFWFCFFFKLWDLFIVKVRKNVINLAFGEK